VTLICGATLFLGAAVLIEWFPENLRT
jgi:hypothetical protein